MTTTEDVNIREIVGRPVSLPTVYDAFLEGRENFHRIHIYLKGMRKTSTKTGEGGAGISKRRNRFRCVRLIDAVADPYVTVETVGPDTGSTNYFPVGKYTFPVLKDNSLPAWDAKGTVLCKKGEGTTEGLKFVMYDKNRRRDDEVLMEFTIPLADLPDPVEESIEAPGTWTEFVHKPDEIAGDRLQNSELVFAIKVTDSWIVSPEDTVAMFQDTEEVAYEEHVIKPLEDSEQASPDKSSLLQSWKHKEGCDSAVLWILGRNDCMMHPHVIKFLFAKYDVFVLNYSMNGCCRRQGWVNDAHLNSHNKYSDFNVYNDQIASALDIIMMDNEDGADGYPTLIGYAHSTGGPVLLNYLLERGDDDRFDGFIFNSPFLDWGFVGGDLNELILENVGFLEKLGILSSEEKLGVAETPKELKETPVLYLGQEVVLCAWSAKVWSQYHFDWENRPLYKVPMTGGFARGVTGVHKKIEDCHEQKKIITSKPFLCITSRGDDVLKSAETVSRADYIGPDRYEVELNDNAHDVFLSQDVSDTVMALEMTKSWMKCKGFL